MGNEDQQQAVKLVYQFVEPSLAEIAGALVDDPESAVADAAGRFDAMIPELAYRDDPGHPMALPLFFCSANLAMYLALRNRGVDVHDYGRAMHEVAARIPFPEPDVSAQMPTLVAAAETSQTDAKPGEFVFEVLPSGVDFDYGVNIKSCGIYFQFSKYDAMDLVPYMCALDDVMSDRTSEGLRRTGTIALGAHQCDFRYRSGGEPRRVAEQYPDRIQIRPAGSVSASRRSP